MKKILILVLALWTGTSNFAYASAKVECADMMKGSSSSESCCPANVPCQCSVEDHARDQSAPNTDGQIISRPTLSVASLAEPALLQAAVTHFLNEPNESPPLQTPIYQLFSVYRI